MFSRCCPFARAGAALHNAGMAIAIVFLLGIANFAMHRAVMDSGHAMVRMLTGSAGVLGQRVMLAVEFGLLLLALLLVSADHAIWAWAYALYSAANALSAWLILSRRI